jgi:hypothetical protein
MTDLAKYMRAPYVDGARGPLAFDCWGLCRAIRDEVFGLGLMPSLGAVGRNKLRSNTTAYRDLKQGMEECHPEPGAIAAVFRGDHLAHVGTVAEVEGQLKIIDTNPGGVRVRTIRDFESVYPRVVYYRDRIFPEPHR